MTHEDLLAKLAARQALIVHFSAHAVMRAGLDFPTDLQQVLAEQKPWLRIPMNPPMHSNSKSPTDSDLKPPGGSDLMSPTFASSTGSG